MTHSPLLSLTSFPHSDSFLEMLAAERGLSKNTCHAYKTDLLSYFQYHGRTDPISTREDHLGDLNDASLRQYLNHLEQRKFSVATRARHLSSIKHYVKFLQQEGHLTHNFTQSFQGPRLGKRLPKILQEDEILNLLKVIAQLKSSEGIRLRCLLEVLYATGMRVSELLTLQTATILQAFRSQQNYLIIQGKGQKERVVPLTDAALIALQDYLTIRNRYEPTLKKNLKQTLWLFPSRGVCGHLTRQGFAKLLKSMAQVAGLSPTRVSPHVIRHAFATHLLNRGADLLSLQKLLGHSDVSTTEIYTHVVNEKMEELVLKHHPLSKI